MTQRKHVFLSAFSTICILAVTGCYSTTGDRPPIEEVTGVVTMDGVPLPQAKVIFHPSGEMGGRRSHAVTDDSGAYRLIYMQGADLVYGAKVGPHTVVISTERDEDDEGGEASEKVPSRYRGRNSELSAVVESGASNDIPFDLVSK
ncbi:hypothetical protein Pan97_38610 [Bremerella volcania]|uniref:Carboxypeptidase regulatory-like domain-containing protein n=1 Tax=Bremerella volcania TaxID=2527984 RepID=A0A518CC76_9BACT|nr:carboxypeptidase regulatory-like domain-containing protein [Bremerella volcania]QDU76804.1 hypothetical protein Pan97_38610 [Bremerella volcania]